MTSLLVESPGALTTVQDLGRPGFGPQGVSPSGAADPVALRLGNVLLGNDPGAAGLEMTLLGGSFVFPEGATIAVTGADLGATLDGHPLEMWTPHTMRPGMKLVLGPTKNFARGYLAIAGGIQVDPFLGSASTHLLSGLGGFAGRALREGDLLRIGKPAKAIRPRKITQAALDALQPQKILRVTEGPQADWFSQETTLHLYSDAFRISEASDRVGLRLEGTLPGVESREMITEGVSLGAVQVTPSGQPIILFVEQQTTGGYPKIANIIGADLHRVGQLRPRAEIRFALTSFAVARSLWIEQERLLSSPERLFA